MSPQSFSWQGYAEEAPELLKRYENLTFADAHRSALHLLPAAPGVVADIGSGTGRDAAALAAMGHQVIAVEPTAEMRDGAMALHPSPSITWIDDCLPSLTTLRPWNGRLALVMMTAVWMHLDADEREEGMLNVASLLAPGAALLMTLRHGPVPAGRRMFDVSAAETERLAAAAGLALVLLEEGLGGRQAGVTWTRIAFSRPRCAPAESDQPSSGTPS